MRKIILSLFILFININYVYADNIKYSKCVDGDTFKLIINGKEETVRLLAVDTPESVKKDTEVDYYGKEASEFTCNKIKNAKSITVEYDPNSDKVDKYDRLLLWVFIDGELLQESLVEGGYAKVAYLYNNYKYTDVLLEKQEIASNNNKGIWNDYEKEEYENNKNNEDLENLEIGIIVAIILLIVSISKIVKSK